MVTEQAPMRIERDVPIPMDDGIVLRADVFLPVVEGVYPIILSYGPYGKGLAFQEGYPTQWGYLIEPYPGVAEGSSNLHQNWEVVDPEKWAPDGYACVRVDSRRPGARPVTWTSGRPRRRSTSTTASSGLVRVPGAMDGSGWPGSRITP